MNKGPVRVEVVTAAGCRRCGRAMQLLKRIAADLGDELVTWRAVDVLKELDHAVELGVRATPSIIIDGRLAITGAPSEATLRRLIAAHLVMAGKKSKRRGKRTCADIE